MHLLTGELLLEASDQGAAENDLNRALTMLALALPGSSRAQLAELSIAERNLALLRLRDRSFGPLLRGFTTCSDCGARVEFSLPVASMVAGLENQLPSGPIQWSESGRQYRLRPANTNDLLGSLDAASVAEGENYVLTRCLNLPEVPPAAREKFEQLNAGAEISCRVECPECSQGEDLDLDIARFVWLEVRNAARRLLREIHELASAYGWTESSIAGMSPQRRRAYLEMLTA